MKNKKTFLAVCSLCLSTLGYSQANEQGNFNIDFGGGAGLYNASWTYDYQNESYSESDLTGASAYLNLNGEYSFLDFLSAGINYKRGILIIDEAFDDKNTLNEIGLQTRFYLMNKDKFTFFGNARIGASFLNQQDIHENDVQTIKWTGNNLGFGAGFKWFWTDNIGMYLSYEYNIHSLTFKSMSYNGEDMTSLYPSDLTIKQKANGSDIKLGLTFKL